MAGAEREVAAGEMAWLALGQLPSYSQAMLLVLRLAIFAFFIAALVHVVRQFSRNDIRRMGISAAWAIATALIGALAIFLGSGVLQDRGEAGLVIFKLIGLLPLAGALWVVIYCGHLLGDHQGGYWVKKGQQLTAGLLGSGAAVLGLLAYSWAVCRLGSIALSIPDVRLPTPAELFTNLTFSLGEEFFYRGCVQALLMLWLVRLPGAKWWAVAVTTLVFTAQHVTTPHLLVLPAGVIFGLLFIRFGLWAAVTCHFAANLVNTHILPRLL